MGFFRCAEHPWEPLGEIDEVNDEVNDGRVPAMFPLAALDKSDTGLVPFHSALEIGGGTPRSKLADPSRLSPWILPTRKPLLELPNRYLSHVPLGKLRPKQFQEMDEHIINQPPPPGVHLQLADLQQHGAQSAAPEAVRAQHTHLSPPNQQRVASESPPQNPQPGSESQPSQPASLPEQGTNTPGTPPDVEFPTGEGWCVTGP